MSKKNPIEHFLRKYPELLNGFDVIENNKGLNTRKDVGLSRVFKKYVKRSKTKKCSASKRQVNLRHRRFERTLHNHQETNDDNTLFTCPICRNILDTPVTVNCGHTFCKDCLKLLNCGNKCHECESDIIEWNNENTNILVQNIVEKWRNGSVSNEGEENSFYSDHRYCLRSRCNGLHNNGFDGTVSKEFNLFTPIGLDRYGTQGNTSEGNWNTVTAFDLECILCSQCFLSPVTTTCGHTFCRECLARVLDHGLACPLCMAPLKITDQHRGETIVLSNALRSFAFEEQRERFNASLQEMENFERSTEIPIFICTNAFPKVACPLFVYEPRYRLLSRRCLQSSTKRFGMAAKTANGDKFALYGTLLEIRDSVNLKDGTSILTTMGLRRFKVLARGEQDGYDTAVVEYIKDNGVEEDKLLRLIGLHQIVHNKTIRWLQTLKLKLLSEIERCIGSMPACEQEWWNLPDGPSWTWWLIAILPLSIQLRVGFLASVSLEKRLLAIDKMLDHLKIRMKAMERSTINCANTEEPMETCSYTTEETFLNISYHN